MEKTVSVDGSSGKIRSVGNVCEQSIRKVHKIGSFSYDRTRVKNLMSIQNNYRDKIIVSHPMASKDLTTKQVILMFFFNKMSFKTHGLKIMLDSA